jgi:L-ascorbate metabolism protein UlaG (beta-lactamase superfamily)
MNHFILFFVLTLTACSSGSNYKKSNHYNGQSFENPKGNYSAYNFFNLVKWKTFSSVHDWPSKIPLQDLTFIPRKIDSTSIIVTYIGQSSILIQSSTLNILIDPIWNIRASQFDFGGPKRVHPPGILFESLPKIDVVLISQNGYDHMDAETLLKLEQKYSPDFIVPLGNALKMKSFGVKKISELDWWDSKILDNNINLTLTPSKHLAPRALWFNHESLWGGYYLKIGNKSIYFSGDTGHGSHFLDIYKKLGAPDLALLPIGGYSPRWLMNEYFMNPEEAVNAHMTLNAKNTIGIHFGTFNLSDEPIELPLQDLELAKEKFHLKNFKTLNIGNSFEIKN